MQIAAITLPDFQASARVEGKTILLHLKGDASGDSLEPLEKLLDQLHREAVKASIEQASVDIRELEFMSSSCFKCFVTWVTDIQSLDEPKQYKLTFQSNATVPWQKRSLKSLHYFAVDLITIEA